MRVATIYRNVSVRARTVWHSVVRSGDLHDCTTRVFHTAAATPAQSGCTTTVSTPKTISMAWARGQNVRLVAVKTCKKVVMNSPAKPFPQLHSSPHPLQPRSCAESFSTTFFLVLCDKCPSTEELLDCRVDTQTVGRHGVAAVSSEVHGRIMNTVRAAHGRR